jgi:Transposase DNA-binding/Transposase Tn5 dimerisation domain
MLAPWVADEMQTADLNDKRITDRLKIVLSQLGKRPTLSIPAACGGRAEMTAAYRFFDNEKTTFKDILRPHSDATRDRIGAQPVVILAQDTTEIDLTKPDMIVRGAGPLDGNARRGALLHVLHGFTPDGTPLGTVFADAWTRDEQVGCATLSRAQRAQTPIEEKESCRWVTTIREAQQVARDCSQTQCICVADSEADIYEFLVEATADPHPVDWVVRACQERALRPENQGETSVVHLTQRLLATAVLFTHSISVRGRKAKVACETRGRRRTRQPRETDVSVRAARVTLRAPYRRGTKLPDVTISVVLVREEHPPENEEPVEWILLTSLPIDTQEQVRQVIQFYCVRWMIEIFFRVLKSGCRVEERRFETLDRQLNCLAVFMIVAWRTLFVCRLARSNPKMNCEAIFEPAEWKSTWKVVRNEDPPREPPPLGQMVHMVAHLGGYIYRAHSEPGPQTIWIGLQRVYDFAFCWEQFGPETKNRVKDV